MTVRLCCCRVVGVHMTSPRLVQETPWNHGGLTPGRRRFAANPAGARPQLIASVRVAVKVGLDAEYA